MLDINPDFVCAIIGKAREFHAKEGVVIPEDSPDDNSDEDWAYQVLADHKNDMTYQEVKAAINDLEPDQQMILVALMWIGRGDFDVSEWDDVMKLAKDRWKKNRTADYLLATPMVADYLSEGMAQLGYTCEE